MRMSTHARPAMGAFGNIVFALLYFALNAPVVTGQTVPIQPPVQAPPPGAVTGTANNASGAPLSGVNVVLIGEDVAAVTDSIGRFTLAQVASGAHTLLFRRIGYQSAEKRIVVRPGISTSLTVTLVPVAQQLNQVVVEAKGIQRRKGTSSIAGVIDDSAGRHVEGADVRLLGSGMSTITDSFGAFQFQSLAAGPYVVRARKEGSAAGASVMQLADDDNRGINIKLFGLPRKTKDKDVPSASGYGIPDLGFEAFDRRMRARSATTMLGPADLFRADGAPLDLLLRQYRDVASVRRRVPANADIVRSVDDGDCLLVDGRRATYRPLSTYTSVTVLMVEIFRTDSFVDDYVLSEMQNVRECRGNMMRHPSYFVLWTRALR